MGKLPPVETVLFVRDEMADLAWGVETRVQNRLEGNVDRRSAWVAPGKLPPGTRDLPAYRVETVVPDYWIPLAPEQLEDHQSIRLRMVPMEVDRRRCARSGRAKGSPAGLPRFRVAASGCLKKRFRERALRSTACTAVHAGRMAVLRCGLPGAAASAAAKDRAVCGLTPSIPAKLAWSETSSPG